MQRVHREGRFTDSLSRTIRMVVLVGTTILFSGCATFQNRPVGDLWRLLPKDQSVYVSSRILENREFIRNILESVGGNTSTMTVTVNRTENVALSVLLAGGERPVLSLVASGSFPEAFIGWKMFWDRDWRKKKGTVGGSSVSWWENDRDRLQMAVSKGRLLSVSNGGIEELLTDKDAADGSLIPEAAVLMGNETDFFVYVPNPVSIVGGNGVEAGVLLGLSSLWAGLERMPAAKDATGKPGETSYAVRGAFVLRDERAARVYGALIKVALASWLTQMGVGNLKTVREQLVLEAEGNIINFTGLLIPEKALEKAVSELLVKALPKKTDES